MDSISVGGVMAFAMECFEKGLITRDDSGGMRRGISRKDDTFAQRILTQTRGTGGAADNLPPLEPMLNEYYAFRGWSDQGIPTEEKLIQSGLAGCLSAA
jgi:aldehyde:ferredoxin oxidoreductase